MDGQPQVTIHVDGTCQGNPGRGEYVIILVSKGRRREIKGERLLTTRNRMVLVAVIEGLKALKTRCAVTIVSDSRYLVDGMQRVWAKRRGMTLNADLWAQTLDLCGQHEVKFQHVRDVARAAAEGHEERAPAGAVDG